MACQTKYASLGSAWVQLKADNEGRRCLGLQFNLRGGNGDPCCTPNRIPDAFPPAAAADQVWDVSLDQHAVLPGPPSVLQKPFCCCCIFEWLLQRENMHNKGGI